MKHLILILLILLGASTARADYDSAAAERKSDWYFMEAMRQKALGHDALYYAMIGRAANLTADATDRAAYERSIQDMYLANALADSVWLVTSLQRAEAYFNANPTDTYAGGYLARVNAELGNTDRTLAIYAILEREKPHNIGIVANHAEYLTGINRLDEAIALYRSLEKSMGRNTQLTQRIANIRAWQGDSVGAMAEVDSLIALYPRSVETLQLGAVAAGALGMPQKVIDYTDRAIALDPTNGLSYYYAANAYNELGLKDEYERAVRGALMGDELDASDKLEMLQYYIVNMAGDNVADGDFEERLAPVFVTMMQQFPQNYDVRKKYFAFLASTGNYEEAAEQLLSAINIDASNPDDYDTLARVYVALQDLDRAEAAAREGMAKFPDNVEYVTLLAGMQSLQNNYAGAAQTIMQALTRDHLTDTERSEFYCTLGDMAQSDASIGRPDDFYDKALELDRSNHLALNNYAYYLSIHDGDLEKAKTLSSKALLYNPDSSTYQDTMAWVCYKLGQIDQAKAYIDKAMQTGVEDPNMAELFQHAGDIYNRAGDKDKAREYWKRAHDLDPDVKSE